MGVLLSRQGNKETIKVTQRSSVFLHYHLKVAAAFKSTSKLKEIGGNVRDNDKFGLCKFPHVFF